MQHHTKFILIFLLFYTNTSLAEDKFLLIFTTNNCQYCEMAKSDIKSNPTFQNKFKEIITINFEEKDIKEGVISNTITLLSIKDNKFINKIWNYTDKKTIIRAAASIEAFPTFTILGLDKNKKFIGRGSFVGYDKSTFDNEINRVLNKESSFFPNFKKKSF